MFDIPYDKALHVIAGLIVFIAAGAACTLLGVTTWREVGVGAALGAGLLMPRRCS